MKKILGFIGIIVLICLLIIAGRVWQYYVTPQIVAIDNTIDKRIQQMDDKTRYETQKKIEDTCRAMISNYTSDKLTYEQYRDSQKEKDIDYANAAKTRANRTASTYNNYILENSFIWEGNIPKDINYELQYIE